MIKTAEDIRQLNDRISNAGRFVDSLRNEVGKVIIGQSYMLDRLLIGLLSNGHVLLEGVPGLAKTLTIKSLATAIHARFSRIQFTPDLRSEEHTSELQSQSNLVCRLLLEKKKIKLEQVPPRPNHRTHRQTPNHIDH